MLGTAFFAYKNKKATLYLSGLSGLAHGQGAQHQFHPGSVVWLLDHSIRSCQHIRRNSEADLLGGFKIDDQLELLRLLDR